MNERKADSTHAAIIRDMIRHEDRQIDARITWFCAVQGLLMAALAFAWGKSGVLIVILAPLGVLISVSTYFSVRAALLAIVAQRNWWDEHCDPEYAGPDVIGRRPDARSIPWLRPYVILPWGFALAWVGLFVLRLFDIQA